MVSRQVYTSLALAGAVCFAIIGLVNAVPITDETASLAVRNPSGTQMGEYVNQPELIKRVNVKLFSTAMASLGAITYTACSADIEPTTKAAICAIAVVGTVISAVSGVIRSLFGREEVDPRLPSQLVHYYPQQEGSTTLKQLHAVYNDTPILVAHSNCFGHGCHRVHYSNKKNAGGSLVHTFAASPRHNASTLQRRKDYSGAGNDGGLFGVYSFINDNPADEKAEGYDGDFPIHIEQASDKDMFANQGSFCYNIEDADDHNNYGPAGYLTLQQDEPYYDPDQEDIWINQCNNSH